MDKIRSELWESFTQDQKEEILIYVSQLMLKSVETNSFVKSSTKIFGIQDPFDRKFDYVFDLWDLANFGMHCINKRSI